MKLSVMLSIEITNEDIDDIMCTALEGGINYWCDNAEVVGDYLGSYASEQISRGGELILRDNEDGGKYTLTLEKFKNGLSLFLAGNQYAVCENLKIETGCIDAEDADMIIQFALFGEIVYG